MPSVRRLVLDVLKPHRPNALDFGVRLAEREAGCRVAVTVSAVDEKTESLVVEIEGSDINYAAIVKAVGEMGASIHSVDQIEVHGDAAEPPPSTGTPA